VRHHGFSHSSLYKVTSEQAPRNLLIELICLVITKWTHPLCGPANDFKTSETIVYAGGCFAIFETLSFVQVVLQLSPPAQEQLRTWLVEHLNQIQKRE
jgi:hypothetical protein